MCPYARFQSVMFDQDTLIVSYDPRRGEQRGPRKRDADYKAEGLGDCIDCKMCVHVCPTGIDIRDGLQDRMHRLRRLYRRLRQHHGQDELPQRADQLHHRTQPLRAEDPTGRPRLIGYAIALLAMFCVFAWAIASRSLVELDVLKDRVLYRENEEGRIENVYTLKIMNKAQAEVTYLIEADGLEGLVYEGKREIKALGG